MRLPEELEDRFWAEHEHYETEHKMRYVTSVERIGIRKGMEKGMEKGVKKGVRKGKTALLETQLVHRFRELPGWVKKRLSEAAPEDLDKWSLRLLDAHSLEEVFATP